MSGLTDGSGERCPSCDLPMSDHLIGFFEDTAGNEHDALACPVPCGICGGKMIAGEAQAEVYDPSNLEQEKSLIVHADTCVPEGWELA